MLKNRLSVLLAERELTAAKVYEETGISRSTLSTLVNNSGDGVQYKTLDTLCNFLEIEPGEFFDYAPYLLDYEIETFGETENENIFTFNHEEFLNIRITRGLKKTVESLQFFFFNDTDKEPYEKIEDANIYAALESSSTENNFIDDIYPSMPLSLKATVRNKLIDILITITKEKLSEQIPDIYKEKNEITIFFETPFSTSLKKYSFEKNDYLE